MTLWRTYYIPVPDFATLPESVWNRRSPLSAVIWDPDRGITWLEQLREHADEPWAAAVRRRPELVTSTGFGGADAAVLFATVVACRPRRIVELGVGHSTVVIAEAVEHLREHADTDIAVVSFDPFPPPVAQTVKHPIRAVAVQDIPEDVFGGLTKGDVLFVDTTHTVQLAGDVNRIILEVLPMLAPGVLIHFHDIFLPYEYPREFVEGLKYLWAEQYLLQAFLQFNESFETLCGLHSLSVDRSEDIRRLGLDYHASPSPSSLWLRRRG
ncbi:MAG TPA: class I SAM-dependent methyltransferase [Solirubrobacteraceae bacterium]|nr:class I SAM-dependent methyltransferase [Solirubrobacteraceae bacterium]